MKSTPCVEERLFSARAYAAVLAKLGDIDHEDAPSPAFWRGISGIAESIERDIEALQHALDADVKAKDAPDHP